MFCPTCGKEIPDESIFCPACGAKLAAPEAETRHLGRSKQEQVIRRGLILVPVLVAAIILGAVASGYNRTHSVSAVSARFVTALQQSDVATLGSLLTVNSAPPDAAQLQTFCTWATDSNNAQQVQQQLLTAGNPSAAGGDSSVPADKYLSFVEKKVLLVLTSYSVEVVPAQATFSGLAGTVVALNGVGKQTIGGAPPKFSSLLPGKYSYTLELPTAFGPLTGSGSVAVEPLTGGTVDVSNTFNNAAWFRVPAGIAATSVSLDGTSVPLQSEGSSPYVGPYPAKAYAVVISVPAPWGTAEYTGTASNSTGVSTITATGIGDAMYEKLKEIAAAIDKFITNDTLLIRKKLGKPGIALQGIESGSAAYNNEKDRIQYFLKYPRDVYFLKMTLSSKFTSLDGTTVEVLCEDQFTDNTVVGDFTFVYKDGKFLLRNLTSSYGWDSDYSSAPRSIVITHKQ